MVSTKVLAIVLGIALAVALFATIPTAAAAPIKAWSVKIVDQTGRPIANEEILIAVWNETGNCALAYFKGKTDSEGRARLTIIAEYPLDTGPSAGTFNVTVAINKYGRWMLLNYSKGISWSEVVSKYVNQTPAPQTIIARHWWSLRFKAVTDPDGNQVFDTPLYFDTGLGEDLASFRVFWNDTRVLITEIFAKKDGTSKVLFNISDTEVIPTEVGTGCFLFKFKDIALYKEVIWNLFANKGESTPITVGAEILKFNPTAKTITITNATPLGKIGAQIGSPISLTPVTEILDYAYTVYFRVNIRDACGSLIDTGAFETWKVFIQTTLDGRSVILRSGLPEKGVAPARGAVAPDAGFAFWVPDITKVYGKKYNVTLNINYYNVQVFTASVPTNRTSLTLTDGLGTYMTLTTTQGIRVVEAITSVVKTRIVVKDMQPTPQPLAGARLILSPVVGDPIYSATGPGGAAFLPPFITTDVVETSGDFGRAYTSVYTDAGVPYGYLPVPFTYRARRDLVVTYTVRIFWMFPGGESWVDVTPTTNTFALNITDQIRNGCPITTFTFFAKVFELKIRVLDLCDRPITPTTFPGAYLVAYLDGKRVGVVGLGADGTMDVGLIPAGKLKFRLFWKGVFLRANITQPEPEIDVTKNIATAVTLRYPIGDLDLKLTMWDIDYQIHKLAVKLQYLKDGKVVYEEPDVKTTDCYGKVTFTQVPLRPLTVDEGAGHTYELRVVAWTREDTPYIRPQDKNLVVANQTIRFEKLDLRCKNEHVVPTWIYSFRVIAVDHTGATLKSLPTDIGTIPVAILLNDTTYGKEKMCCPDICAPPTCVCPAPGVVTVDFRILNETKKTDEAIFVYHSQQYFDSDPEKDSIGIKPHMFVAGAKYHFMVFHGGVLVYNYTITLPKPFETKTVFFNETSREVSEVEGETYTYTWLTDRKGSIKHPILVFKGAKNWNETGKRADAQLKLVTWVQTLEVKTFTNAGKYTVPFLNLTLIRTDVLNWTRVGGKYSVLSKPAKWANNWTNYAWNAVGGSDGVIKIQVPVWVPSRTGTPWIRSIKFGAEITHVAVLAGKWKPNPSPGAPDTPKAITLTLPNATGFSIAHTLFGYIVNWNHTAKSIEIDAKKFYPTWTKAGVTFRGNNTWFLGDFWNMTYWSGASKTVRTVAMDGFCVIVRIPPPCPGGDKKPYPNVPVWVEAIGETGERILLASGTTDRNGTAKFSPGSNPPVFAYKFKVANFTGRKGGLPEIDYNISTRQNFEELLVPYGLDVGTAGICPETLYTDPPVKFDEDHNDFGKCIVLEWEGIYLWIEDWNGKPLINMMVTAAKVYPDATLCAITTFNFSRPFAGSACARLLVTPGSAYRISVFWRDSYLLAAAKEIPKYINIYDSFADEITPRLFATRVLDIPGFVTSPGGTIKTFVYVGLIELRTKEGKPLSEDALKKINVIITWPDGVVTAANMTNMQLGSDGVAKIILNKATVKSWHSTPRVADATQKYSPESPHPQSPAGDYKVAVEWAGVGKIAEKTLRIQRAKLDTPEVREPVYVDVVDVGITLTTPFNTPMAGATVRVAKLDGTTQELTADAQGRIIVPEVPLGRVDVTVTTWNGLPVNFPAGKVAAGAVTVKNIGKLVVTVVGARGQGLEGAKVTISGGVTVVGTTDAAGKFAVELPAGTGPYTVSAEKGGRTASTSVSVTGGQTTEATLKVDVFMTLAGWEMSFSEFVGLLLLIALLAIVLFIIAHEYAVWRRRRLARAIVPARAEGA